MLPGLPTVTVTRLRYPAQTIDPVTFRATDPTPTSTSIVAIEEPWRADASPARPDGMTGDDTRLFVSYTEVVGTTDHGTGNARRPDRIVCGGVTWEVAEVVDAPAMPGISRAWHAYCTRVRPGDEP